MVATVDNLQIEITANSQRANAEIDKLTKNLDKLSSSLGRLDTKGVQKFASGMQMLSRGMQGLSNVKLPDYTRVAKGINKLANIDGSRLASVSNALTPLANSLRVLGGSRFDNRGLQNLINSLTRLANSNVGSLVNADLGRIGNSILDLTNKLAGANKVQQSTISITNAIANLAKSGRNLPAVTSALAPFGVALRSFITNVSSAGTVSSQIIQFVNAIGLLASAGDRTRATASNLVNLANELKKFMQIMSTAPRVSNNIISMTNALARLATQGGRVSVSTRTMTSGLHNTHNAMSRLNVSTTSLAQAFGKFYANYFLVVRGIKKLWSAISGTTDYIESFNYYNVAFGKIASEWDKDWEKYGYSNAETYANSFTERLNQDFKKLSGVSVDLDAGLLKENGMKNLGMDINEMTQYAANIASVTNSVGLTGEASTRISQSLVKLAGDVSSLFNQNYESVATNFSSGLIGQSRALYKYGIDITNATLQTYAYNLGVEKAVSEMTQAEKMQLRMIAILDQSKVSWGDLANTINSPSNMIRQFTNNLSEAGMMLGQMFIPLLSKVLPVLNAIMVVIKRFLGYLATLLGISVDFEGFGQGFTDIDTSGIDDTTDSANDASSAYKDATKNAKKWKNQLLSFDEINKLEDTDTSDSDSKKNSDSGAGATIDLTDQIAKMADEYEKVWNAAFEKMESKSQKLADKIQKALVKAWETEDGYDLGKALAKWINKGIKSINASSFSKTLMKLSNILATALNGYIETFDWSTFGTTVGDMLSGALEAQRNFFKKTNWSKLGQGLAKSLNKFIESGAIQSYLALLGSKLRAVIETAFGLIDKFDFKALGTAIGDGINKFMEEMSSVDAETGLNGWQKLGKGLTKLASGIADALSSMLKELDSIEIGEAIGQVLSSIDLTEVAKSLAPLLWRVITNAFGLLVGMFKEAPLETSLIAAFGFLKFTKTGEKIAETLTSAITSAVELSGIGTSISNVLSKLAPVATTLGISVAVAIIGYKIGEKLYEKLTGEKAEGGIKDLITDKVSFEEIGQAISDGAITDITITPLVRFLSGDGSITTEEVIDNMAKMIEDFVNGVKKVIKKIPSIPAKISEGFAKAKDWLAKKTLNVTFAIASILDAFRDKWNKVKDWLGSKVLSVAFAIASIKEKFQEKWQLAKDWVATKSMDVKFAIDSVKEKMSEKWSSANDWIKEKSMNIKFTIDNIKDKVKTAFESVKAWWKNNATLAQITAKIKMPHIKIDWDTKGASAKMLQKLGLKGFPTFSVEYYANGGFPQQGQLFVAREKGAEMVGSMGNKTAVANNDQIVAGIQAGVYSAVMAAGQNIVNEILSNSGSENRVELNIDGKTIAEAVIAHAKKNKVMTNGHNIFMEI